jgi:hypothetical protein
MRIPPRLARPAALSPAATGDDPTATGSIGGEEASTEDALRGIERYWRRRRLRHGAWCGIQIAGALSAGWLSLGLTGSFALFSLGGAGFVIWRAVHRLRQLLAGFIVARDEQAWQQWRVCVSNAGLVFRCEDLVVSLKTDEIQSACHLLAREDSSGVTPVLFLSLDIAPATDSLYRSAVKPAPRVPCHPLLIPATAAGFEALVSWLKATVPFERRRWPA